MVEMEVMTGSAGNVKPGEVIDSLGINGCEVTEIVRTGLFKRLPDGVKLLPL